ncbi:MULTISPECIES: hypothetical protein [Streptosporangium]|uniref:Uncharacterized protein n=1 Tax=Streptosporangium brasiliense TaxID=47480 RepID=A0ABT9RGA9_9ACTN|nr:hypothetical protein [Streptosporangium brasiliense]MDP9868318.1 hypothetical protein [Streptosporangium brasiliense]
MIWLTWRQFRGAAAMTAAALVVLAAVLALTGPGLAAEYSTGITACARDATARASSTGSSPTTRPPSWPSPPSCWSFRPWSGSSGEHR